MLKIFYIFFIIIATSSCSFLLKKVYLGLKKPKIENEKSLTNYLLKKEVDTSSAFIIKDSLYMELISYSTKYFSKHEVFNSRFEKISPSDSLINKCYGSIALALKEVDDSTLWVKDTSGYNISKVLQQNILELNGEHVTDDIFSPNEKYYVIFYWAKFMGRYTKSLLKTANYVENLNNSNVKVITLNMDKNAFMNDSIKNTPFEIN